jgi:hypothetical protein
MWKNRQVLALSLAVIVLSFPASPAAKKKNNWQAVEGEITGEGPAVLWRKPANIAARNLFYGIGGKEHEPHGPFTFLEEDLEGSSPKFNVRDRDGVRWKVKLGQEARPETAASRLVWAVGYFTNEDYLVPELRVENMPRLHRGRKFVAPDGLMRNARLKRYLKGEKKIGNWRWCCGPFTNTREWDGLRVMMALIDNWDLKDVNNAVYQERSEADPEQIYMVSDLGASFGSPGFRWPVSKSRDNLKEYRQAKFIRTIRPEYVNFTVPSRPSIVYFFLGPRSYLRRRRLGWIGKDIRRQDARWVGELLGQLSREQVRDVFRAAAYSPPEVEAFGVAVERRIAELKEL